MEARRIFNLFFYFFRPLWRHYFEGTHGLIFVVDSNDRARITEARDELKRMMSEEELRNAALLIFANKQGMCFYIRSLTDVCLHQLCRSAKRNEAFRSHGGP